MISRTDDNGRIISINKKFCDVTQYSPEELIGNSHQILNSGYHSSEFFKNLWGNLKQGKMWTGLIQNKTKDGTFYWCKSTMIPVMDNGNPQQFICTSTELNISGGEYSKLKNAEIIQRALNEASIVAITDEIGKIIYVNKKFCEISKYSKDELLGQNHRILKSGYHDLEFYHDLWKTISSGKIWRGLVKNKARDGSFYWVRTIIMPVVNNVGIPIQYISIRTDITSEKELSEKLLHSERMMSIGQLSSRMAHDIRNPLSIIRVSLENLKLKYGANESAEKSFDRVGRSIDRIAHQIDNVLDFVNGRTPVLNKVKCSEIISEAFDSIVVPSRIKLDLPENDIEISADKKLFAVAINNLILNAIQAIDGKGTIEITYGEDKGAVTIQVKDSGKGIPKKDLDKIFELLYTTKQQGTGLGLSSVKSIIESHGGIISVTSPPTIFTITLPKPSE